MTKAEYVAQAQHLLPGLDVTVIGAVVSTVFRDMCGRADWQFLLVPDPVAKDFVENQEDYDLEIPSFASVFQLEYQSTTSTTWIPLDYQPWKLYNEVKAGEAQASKTPIYTWKGQVATGDQRFGLWPLAGGTANQFRIFYFAEGSDSMMSRMSDRWAATLLNGVQMYLVHGVKGTTVGQKAYFIGQYEAGIERMLTREPVMKDYVPPFMVDDYAAARMRENNDEDY